MASVLLASLAILFVSAAHAAPPDSSVPITSFNPSSTHSVTSVSLEQTATENVVTTTASGTSATTPDFSSVVSVMSVMSLEASASLDNPAINVPKDHPDAENLSSLAALWPPTPSVSVGPDVESYAKLLFEINAANEVPYSATKEPKLKSRQNQKKVMIVGDSMTQGAEGDWTWRYRFWEWQYNLKLNFQFVGPYLGTQLGAKASAPQPPPLYGASAPAAELNIKGGYATKVLPDWYKAGSCNHFSIWGRSVAVNISKAPGEDVGLIQSMVAKYQPDILLVMLGFNDLGWFYSNGSGLLTSMRTFIQQARAANPNIAIALANVPQRRWLGRQDLVDKTNYYNSHIGNTLLDLEQARSPLRLVKLRETFSCGVNNCPAGYDGLHPDALGDFEIAKAFSTTLVDEYSAFGIPSGLQPLAVPSPVPLRPVSVPKNLKVFSSPQGVTATWDPVYGAFGYRIQTKLNDGPWQDGTVSANRWDTVWPSDRASYSFRVAMTAGEFDYLNSAFTDPQTAVATPELPPPPTNIKTYPHGQDGLRVEFTPPTGPYTDSIAEYQIIYWDLDTQCAFIAGAAFKSSPAIITGLKTGNRYLIMPATWNKNGMSFPASGKNVRVGGTTPQTPSTPTLQAIDEGTLHITWTGDAPNSAGYTIFLRNFNEKSDSLRPYPQSPGATCFDMGILFPGYWNYEFCLGAYNGNQLSGNSTCARLPAPTGKISPAPICPPAAPWCPGFGQGSSAPAGSDTGGSSNGPTSNTGGTAGDGAGEGGAQPQRNGVKQVDNTPRQSIESTLTLGKWATGTWTSTTCFATAIFTPTPSATPKTMQLGINAGNFNEAKFLWNATRADDALNELLSEWVQSGSKTFDSFNAWLGQTVVGAGGVDSCTNLDGGDCLGIPYCDSGFRRPALTYIATSLTNFYSIFRNLKAAYMYEDVVLSGAASDFTSTFVQEKNAKGAALEKALLNFMAGFIPIPVGRIFGTAASNLGKSLSTAAEGTVGGAIGASTDAAKDSLTSDVSLADNALKIQSLLSGVLIAYRKSFQSMIDKVFDKTDSSLIKALLSDGGLLYMPQKYNEAYSNAAKKDFAGALFQAGWDLTGTGFNVPFVMFIPYYTFTNGCTARDGKFKKNVKNDPTNIAACLDARKLRHMYCDNAGNGYLLLNAGYSASQLGPVNPPSPWEPFPGMDQLDGNHPAWNNLNAGEMAYSAFMGYRNRGYSNAPTPPSNKIDIHNPQLGLPDGYFHYPVCTHFSGVDGSFATNRQKLKGEYPPCNVNGWGSITQVDRAYRKNDLKYGPGDCSVSWRIFDANPEDIRGDFEVFDNFGEPLTSVKNLAIPKSSGTTQSPINPFVATIATIAGNIDLVHGITQDSVGRELLSFRSNKESWDSTESARCKLQGKNKDNSYWDGACTFSCGP